jgi:hypothetical protein
MSTYALGIGEGILSVRAEMIGWAGSSTANNVSLLGNVGGSNDTLFALADPALDNSLTGCWLAPMYTASGGWTQAKLDALAFIFGGGTDVSPTPGINFAFAEVAVRTDDSPAAASIDVKFDDLQILSCVED